MGIKPPLMEVSQLIKPTQPPVGVTKSALSGDSALFRAEDAASLLYPTYNKPTEPPSTTDSQTAASPVPLTPSRSGTDPLQHSSHEGSSAHLPGDGSSASLPDFNENKMLAKSASESSAVEKVPPTEKSRNDTVGDSVVSERRVSFSESDSALTQNSDPFSSGDNMAGDKAPIVNQISNALREDGGQLRLRTVSCESSEVVTPVLGSLSGLETPVLTDQMLQAHARETSWVIKLCMKNILGKRKCHIFCE